MKRLGIKPDIFLSICRYPSVDETARILSEGMSKDVVPIEVASPLTNANLPAFFADAKDALGGQIEQSTIVIVGDGPSLNLILKLLTSQKARSLDLSEAVWVWADSQAKFCNGKGRIRCRIPVVDETELQPKIQSKMTVATFLAGFAFTVLANLLMLGQRTPWQIIAMCCLTAAVALFIVAVYIYDELAMPKRFQFYDSAAQSKNVRWFKSRPRGYWRGSKFRKDVIELGPTYAYMVWTWHFVFTLGVIAGVVGFVCMLLNTEPKWSISWSIPWPIIGIGLAVLLVLLIALYGWFARPALSTD